MLINKVLIYIEKHTVKNPKGNIIITHGIAQHSSYYKEVAKRLNEASYNVYLYDLRGHGKSGGKRGYVKSIKDFISDLHQIVKMVNQESKVKTFLLGHSMGGVISNIYSTTYDDIDGTIICASPTKSNLSIFFRIFMLLFGFVKVKTNFSDSRLSSIQNDENDLDPFSLKYFYLRLARQVVVKGTSMVRRRIKLYNKPILFIQGNKDKLVNPQNGKNFIDKLPMQDKEYLEIDNGLHNLLNDTTMPVVVDSIIVWLNNHVK